MKISITKGIFGHLEDCTLILKYSILGQKYFVDRNNQYIGQKLFKEGFEKGEIYVAHTTHRLHRREC